MRALTYPNYMSRQAITLVITSGNGCNAGHKRTSLHLVNRPQKHASALKEEKTVLDFYCSNGLAHTINSRVRRKEQSADTPANAFFFGNQKPLFPNFQDAKTLIGHRNHSWILEKVQQRKRRQKQVEWRMLVHSSLYRQTIRSFLSFKVRRPLIRALATADRLELHHKS